MALAALVTVLSGIATIYATSPTTPERAGYLAALINCRYIANALWSAAQTLELLDENSVSIAMRLVIGGVAFKNLPLVGVPEPHSRWIDPF